MPMIWEGKTPGQICQQLKDPKQNNNKTVAQIVDHVTNDKLVLWGWNPGGTRVPVSVSPQEGFLHPTNVTDTLGFDQPETKCKFK